ncbi:MAG: extracellular solute-binding protein [Treponemataceae bacterium]|nr:extracellular solute-binding protein [Treponemataceae bacterium]
MKKVVTVALVLCLALTCVFAGGKKESANGVKEITFMFWDDLEASNDLVTIGYADVIDRFNKDHEGQVQVKAVCTNLEEYYLKLTAMIASGDAPDVFIASPGPDMYKYTDTGVCLDLTADLNSDWGKTFNNGVFSRVTRDGKIMAVPLNIAAACCFYNTKIFAECGITKEPETLDELLAACKKIEAKGYTPISCSAGTAWCLSMVAGYLCERNGVDLNAIADKKAKWTDANCIKAGTDLATLSQYFSPDAGGLSNDEATAEFYNGNAGILIQGSWVIGQMNGNNPAIEKDCGVFPFPAITKNGGDNQTSIIAKSDSLCVSVDTKNRDAAIELLKYFTDETAQKYVAEKAGKFPVTNAEIDYNVAPAQLKYVLDVMGKANKQFGFYNESLATVEAGSTFDNFMVSIFMKQMTPAEAFKGMQEYYESEVY